MKFNSLDERTYVRYRIFIDINDEECGYASKDYYGKWYAGAESDLCAFYDLKRAVVAAEQIVAELEPRTVLIEQVLTTELMEWRKEN